jgi:transmembrane sensor
MEFFSHTYTSAIGEVRTISLPDGSIVYLNTQTRLKWIGTKDDRRVLLLDGEALFEVVHDPNRPFRIVLDNSEIRVLGTRFDVYRKTGGNVVVTVLSGAVAVDGFGDGSAEPSWHTQLTANQQIEYTPTGLVADVHSIVAPKAVEWREGVLEAEEEPLPNVVRELRRYTNKQILIEDPRLNAQIVGGAFTILDVSAALRKLEKSAPVAVTPTDSAYILTYRAETPSSRSDRGEHP